MCVCVCVCVCLCVFVCALIEGVSKGRTPVWKRDWYVIGNHLSGLNVIGKKVDVCMYIDHLPFTLYPLPLPLPFYPYPYPLPCTLTLI